MLNRVMLIGRLGKDPEVRRLETGAAVAKFTMATDESYKDTNGNKVEQTEWHNVVVWRTQAEIAEKFLKANTGENTPYAEKPTDRQRIADTVKGVSDTLAALTEARKANTGG